jgi:hypothetical protein
MLFHSLPLKLWKNFNLPVIPSASLCSLFERNLAEQIPYGVAQSLINRWIHFQPFINLFWSNFHTNHNKISYDCLFNFWVHRQKWHTHKLKSRSSNPGHNVRPNNFDIFLLIELELMEPHGCLLLLLEREVLVIIISKR